VSGTLATCCGRHGSAVCHGIVLLLLIGAGLPAESNAQAPDGHLDGLLVVDPTRHCLMCVCVSVGPIVPVMAASVSAFVIVNLMPDQLWAEQG
jgi:hypothetical protein